MYLAVSTKLINTFVLTIFPISIYQNCFVTVKLFFVIFDFFLCCQIRHPPFFFLLTDISGCCGDKNIKSQQSTNNRQRERTKRGRNSQTTKSSRRRAWMRNKRSMFSLPTSSSTACTMRWYPCTRCSNWAMMKERTRSLMASSNKRRDRVSILLCLSGCFSAVKGEE